MSSKKKLFWGIFLIGCLVRLFYLGNIPGNREIYADEAISAYDAFSLLFYGFDMNGYRGPVYLVSWGDGTSILQPYLTMPFIRVLGLSSLSIRLPQALLGCATLPAVFYIAKKLRDDEGFGLFAMLIYSIMPWEIMMCRWALDCNIIVPILIFATAAVVKSYDDERFLPLVGLTFGLCLYSYALPWAVMPVIAAVSYGVLVLSKRVRHWRYLLSSFGILGAMAAPLLVFLLVNLGYIPEIRTDFISMPLIPSFRSGELSLSPKAVMSNLNISLKSFVEQQDGRKLNVTPMYGLYYRFSLLPILIGMAATLLGLRKKKNVLELVIWGEFVAGVLLCAMMSEAYFNRVNIIHFPLTYFLAVGLYELILHFGDIARWSVCLLYGAAFFFFMCYYMTEHDAIAASANGDGYRDTMEYLCEDVNKDLPVHVLSGLSYSIVLFYESFPTDEYLDTVEYTYEEDDPKAIPIRFGRYDYTKERVLEDEPALYVCKVTDKSSLAFMEENVMEIEWYTSLAVGRWKLGGD